MRAELGQIVAARLDIVTSKIKRTDVETSYIPQNDPFESLDTSAPTKVDFHTRYNSAGDVDRRIAHIKDAEGHLLSRRVFFSASAESREFGELIPQHSH
ncbi:MAG TPA: hypothetical protein VKC89_00795 [Patescibacteria group bacterium]|nr:hypothetical protein [Patescibacteria group bacterium]